MDATNDIKRRLQVVTKEIEAILALLDQSAPVFPEKAARMLADGVCLECEKRMTKAEASRSRRGCHEKCYRKIMRAIEDGSITEAEALSFGKLAPKQTHGRTRSPTSIEKLKAEQKSR